ncbi:MAG: siderophore-interacting protein [Actinomycetota bacterium]
MSAGQVIRQNTRKNQGTVTSIEAVGDGLRRVVFDPREAELRWRPGMAVGVIVDPDGTSLRDRWRHYTIRRQHDDGALEFLLTVHDTGGPGVDWLQSLEPGSSFTFMGPGGNPTVETGHDHYVFVGDRTSLASMGAMRDALPDTASVTAIVATPDPDRASFDSPALTDVRWVAADRAETIRAGLVDAVQVLEPFPPDTQAYVTGEMVAMRDVRRTLAERGVGRRRVGAHAHWTPDRRGM